MISQNVVHTRFSTKTQNMEHGNCRRSRPAVDLFRFFAGVILGAIVFPIVAAAQLTVTPPMQNTQSVNVGSVPTFTVLISGQSGTVSYQWQFSPGSSNPPFGNLADGTQPSGSTVSGSSTATLTISNTQSADSGRYRCIVTDSTGPKNSGPGHLNVTTGLPFTITPPFPTPQSVSPGATVSFEADVSGQSGTLFRSWQFLGSGNTSFSSLSDGPQPSGSTIIGSGLPILRISNAQTGDSGKYRQLVSDSVAGGKNSGPGTLTVSSLTVTPPNINLGSTSCETLPAPPPETAVFKVQPSGQGPFTYQWKFSSSQSGSFTPLSDGVTTQGATISGSLKASLEVANVTPSTGSAGYYQVVVTDGSGASVTSQNAHLDISSSLTCAKPDFVLVELDGLIEHGSLDNQGQPQVDWQIELTTTPHHPFFNGENKAVVGAALSLFYGPRFTVLDKMTQQTKETDYRCWWDTFLKEQTGHLSTSGDDPDAPLFVGNEIGSFDYNGSVDMAVAAAYYWTTTADAAQLESTNPPSCDDGASGLRSDIQLYAREYLRDAVGLYVLSAAPAAAVSGFGVTSGAEPDKTQDANGHYLYYYPNNLQNATAGPYITLPGQRTLWGFWANDQRQPTLCAALNSHTPPPMANFACDSSRPFPGAKALLSVPLSTIWANLFSQQEVTDFTNFIKDQPSNFNPVTFVGPIKSATEVDFLKWTTAHVRATCMHDQVMSFNPPTLGVVYWPNVNSLSAGHASGASGTEVDFLYDGCIGPQDCTGGSSCKVTQLSNGNYQLDGGDASGKSRTLHLPSGSPDHRWTLDSNGLRVGP